MHFSGRNRPRLPFTPAASGLSRMAAIRTGGRSCGHDLAQAPLVVAKAEASGSVR
jgi:hypothetical protein